MTTATTTEIVPADLDARAAEVERQVAQARAQAEAIEVRNDAENNVAAQLLKEIARRRKESEAERTSLVKPLNDHVKLINQKFKDASAPYDEADRIVRGKVSTYQEAQERIRREEEARLEAERQEREREAREAREKQEAEARAVREKAEKEAREAEELRRQAKDEADREVAEALAEEAREKAQEAQTAESAIASLPEVSLPKAVVEAPAKQDGIANRTKREPFIVDREKLPRTLPDGTPLEVVDMVALRRWMNAEWTATGEPPELPGAEFKRVPDGLTVKGG